MSPEETERERMAEDPMTPEELLRMLADIERSQQWLADQCGEHKTQVRRWTTGEGYIPQDVAKWLRGYHAMHTGYMARRPPPRRRLERKAA